jgi:hypothetical protein
MHTASHAHTRWTGYMVLLTIALLFLTFVYQIAIASQAFPGITDRIIPVKIQANILVLSLESTLQLLYGTAMIALAILLSYYHGSNLTNVLRIALVAGIIGGAGFVAAGAIAQEKVFLSVFLTPEQSKEIATAIGAADHTVINMALNVAAGGMRSAGSYAFGWALILWGIFALRAQRFPVVLNWIGIGSGLLFALTNWIGPIAGPLAFVGLIIWHVWLGFYLLRRNPAIMIQPLQA